MKNEKIWSFTADDFLVSYCRGSKNKCAQCGEPLMEEDLRFGIIFTHNNNQNICVLWYHLDCTKAPLDLKDSTQLHGIEDIKIDDQVLMKEWITGAYHKRRLQLAQKDLPENKHSEGDNTAKESSSDSTSICPDGTRNSLLSATVSKADTTNTRKTSQRPHMDDNDCTPPHKRSATDSQVLWHLNPSTKLKRPFTPNQSIIGAPATTTLHVGSLEGNKENVIEQTEHQSSDEDADCDSPTNAPEAPIKFLSCSSLPSKREMQNQGEEDDQKSVRAKEIEMAVKHFAMDEAKDLIRRCASFRGVKIHNVEEESLEGVSKTFDAARKDANSEAPRTS